MLPNAFYTVRGAAVAVGLALLAGCAATEPPAPLDLAQIKTLGVHSICGNILFRQVHGLFDIEERRPAILVLPPKVLNGLITSAFHTAVPKAIDVDEIALDLPRVAAAVNADQTADEARLWRAVFADAPPRDAYVVIFPKYVGARWVGGRVEISRPDRDDGTLGMGLSSRMLINRTHAACGAFLYDPRRGAVVRRYAVEEIKRLPSSWAKDGWTEYSHIQLLDILDAFSTLSYDVGKDLGTQFAHDPDNAHHVEP